jgi:hypothetical protein
MREERPSWLTGNTATAIDPATEQRTRVSRGRTGPLAEEVTTQQEVEEVRRALREDAKRKAAPLPDDPDAHEDEDEKGLLATLRERWYLLVGAATIFLLLVVGLPKLFSAGPEAPAQPEPKGGEPVAKQQAPPETEDTGVIFRAEPPDDEGNIKLLAGEKEWEGRLEPAEGGGEILTLQGPTAAQFKRGFELEGGAVTTGVFAVARPDGPVVHATFQRAATGSEEWSTGTYYVISGDEVVLEGSYTDVRPDPGSDGIVRTYEERTPGEPGTEKTFSVGFEAPEGIPIPELVGWAPPEGLPAVDPGGEEGSA